MRARSLGYPLFVFQTTLFGMPDVCRATGEWVEHGIKKHEVRDRYHVQFGFRVGEASMGHMKLLLSKGEALMRGEVH